jgi:NDP-sugar pyrophosphorylase family protein
MEQFQPENYFDLSNFVHKDVFVVGQPVWETLKNIKPYIAELFSSGELEKSVPDIKNVTFAGDNISIGEDTKIFPGAYISDNVIIGKNCEIRPGAFIRENVIVGDDCVIGNSSELKNTILLDKANAPHYNYVGDSIIGNGCNLGAGTITGNLRFDHKNILIKIGDEKVDTGIHKFGVILGDGSQTGCNAVTNPGTIVGKNSFLGSSKTHQGIIEENSKLI